MNTRKTLLLISVLLLIVIACKEKPEVAITGNKIEIGQTVIINTSTNNAQVTTTVSNLGGNSITQHGHCWSINQNPNTSDSKTTNGTMAQAGSYSSELTNLTSNTTYYVRPYLTYSNGTLYGSQVTITTSKTGKPLVTTKDITNISISTAIGGGEVTQDSGLTITQRGIVWGTNEDPILTSNNGQTSDGAGLGAFTSNLINLTEGSTYYVRAYATNEKGTSYGQSVSFITTSITIPSVTTSDVTNITINSAQGGGNVTSAGNGTVTSRGVCWSTSQSPTIADSKTTDGTGTGVFASSITGLNSSATYYVRAYATNEKGTAYGDQKSFTTIDIVLPTVITTTPTNITTSTTQIGGNVTSDGNATVTERGVVYATTQNPTTDNTKVAMGNGTGSFSNTVSGLTSSTTYYVRAYAINSQGTAYGTQMSFTTQSSSEQTVTDIDGNIYHTVTIGTQIWMVENLKTTKYNDGTNIPNITDNTNWISIEAGAYCWNNNDANYKNTYGALYNWYAVNTGKLCPTGWHVPTDAEWTTLTTFLGGESVAGDKLKEEGTNHWPSSNVGTNSSGFTALPGGYRYEDFGAGVFWNFGSYGYWWTSSEFSTGSAFYRAIGGPVSSIGGIGYSFYKFSGLSVRCVRD